MEKYMLVVFNLLAVSAVVIFPWLKPKQLARWGISLILLQSVTIAPLALWGLVHGTFQYILPGSYFTGDIPLRIDPLSAWFMMIMVFTFVTGSFYGVHYLRDYREQGSNLIMHAIAFVLAFTSLIDLCLMQNAFIFLVLWEIMALSSFVLIIFEHDKKETLKAGINFLVQAHISILFLTVAFIWTKVKTGSFDFASIPSYTLSHPAMGLGLFCFLFIGFAIKAGFVPFHTWLPLAHPAAPAHVSGIMSGVIIKIGIFGILRMITFIRADYTTIGYLILTVSVITGIYGVMLAIIQHNLKRLLAYHSIENIGIIGIGMGLGCLGIGTSSEWLMVTGFGGALLHTLNHSLFKSLLFYSAGNVYKNTHTMNIEAMGGLIRRIPHSSWLFLIGSLAICGLPPFNGFVSEFFIYSGLFKGLSAGHFIFTLVMLFSILALALIGGLALICFTKAFGVVFLGRPRSVLPDSEPGEQARGVVPLYIIGAAIVFIGIFPFVFNSSLERIISLFGTGSERIKPDFFSNGPGILTNIGLYSAAFMVLTAVLFFIRRLLTKRSVLSSAETWGCGFTGDAQKAQYTASSYVRSYRKLVEPALLIKKKKITATGLYPGRIDHRTHPLDKLENTLIDRPVRWLQQGLNRFIFLQNGNIQAYIFYGFIFIIAVMVLPLLISKFLVFLGFLNQI